MFKTIAIDGACRRNGKPDCIAAGACFVLDEGYTLQSYTLSQHEIGSTSQRGELMGLMLALDHIYAAGANIEPHIITDSEYLFNTMTKEWVNRWENNGWKTAQGEDVKNKDLWQDIWNVYRKVHVEITFVHIKGHLLSIGAKKSRELLYQDKSGYSLFMKAQNDKDIPLEKRMHAQELSVVNNGFKLPDDVIQQFAAMNLVADAVANLSIEALEASQWQSVLSNDSHTVESMI